ncbi:MAG: T9SS type A sorting domain-containing protein [Bacteroidales bacterium]|jgi:exonuclease III|nr:T9SS type A sorting domain-containing protein [Bacteroidales bacterium]
MTYTYLKILFTRFLFSVLITSFSLSSQASDTIRMMHYNLMYYTSQTPSDCTGDEAYLTAKDQNLKTVIHHILPDVLCVCEMGSQTTFVDRFQNNVLNTDGINFYSSCPLTNYSGGTIANMLYYNNQKLGFHSYFHISTSYRDINAYKLYSKSQGLSSGDTVFITFLQAHLKAGSSSSDESARTMQIERLLSTLEQRDKFENFVFSGDFNFYGASEPAYQKLLYYDNTLFAFYDPANLEGEWHNNSAYTRVHTQSTHTSAESGECFATGGLDDRFDFILVSPFVYYGTYGARSLNESYHALGQDGTRFNRTINTPSNSLVPATVANALYNASDHLPVILDLVLDATLPVKDQEKKELLLHIENPIQQNLVLIIHAEESADCRFQIFDVNGRCLQTFERALNTGANRIEQFFPFSSSFYFLVITDSNGNKTVRKVVK